MANLYGGGVSVLVLVLYGSLCKEESSSNLRAQLREASEKSHAQTHTHTHTKQYKSEGASVITVPPIVFIE